MKPFVNAILIVEGTHDVTRITTFFDVLDFVVTNGFDINIKDLEYLESVKNIHKVIVLTDSDEAGSAIRKSINNKIDGLIQVCVDVSKCSKNNKHGVAECEYDELFNKLKPYVSSDIIVDYLSVSDLFSLGLVGCPNCKEKRKIIEEKFILGDCNANNFIRRCTIKDIKFEELKYGN